MALSIVQTQGAPVTYSANGKEISLEPIGRAPSRLGGAEARIWNRVVKESGRNLVRADREVLAQYCDTAARVDELKALVVKEGHTQTNTKGDRVRSPASVALSTETGNALKFLTALGLTPNTRVRAPVVR